MRDILPNRRYGETFSIKRPDSTYSVTLGFYDTGRIGEVFITGPKVGSDTAAVARDGAVLLSLALQFGVPLETMRHAITREADASAATIIGAVIDRLSDDKTRSALYEVPAPQDS